ncbi:MAG: hypothetical protein PHE53_14230 [Thermoguttaceae bacterium]|nr:hypothetical protein [Thermoguttaceae bacterium]
MRKSCRYCTLKHIGSAMVLAEEIANGNLDPTHVAMMIGHLGQAESQSQERWPEIAQTLRKIRQNAEENYWNALDMRKTSCTLETDLAYVANRLADLTAPIPLPESSSGPGPAGEPGVLGGPHA